uniref:Uncharacterized protein n=1 Tax=Anguilla anguilla TaxID=7936 RepID=A0A0E9S8E8_ANGAN
MCTTILVRRQAQRRTTCLSFFSAIDYQHQCTNIRLKTQKKKVEKVTLQSIRAMRF